MAPDSSNVNYGTVPANGTANEVDEERAPLLSKSSDSIGIGRRLRSHFTDTVTTTHGDLALLGCYIITGLLDSSSVYAWGSFVSMQTGNSIYLGSGIVTPNEDNKWIRALISIASFSFGSFAFSRFHQHLGGRQRWVLVLSYTMQLVFMAMAAIMVTVGPAADPKGPLTVWVAVPIALIAFQSAGQAYVSRVLKFGSLTSAVLTSIYLDLFSDPNLFVGLAQNLERNRKAAAPLLLLVGATLGGLWAHSPVGIAGALWSAVLLKLLVIGAWCFWAAEKAEA